MSNFMDGVKDTLVNGSDNVSVTENGAVGYRTTGLTRVIGVRMIYILTKLIL